MRGIRSLVGLLGAVATLMLFACTPDTLVAPTVAKHIVQPNCIAGCNDPDPAPDSAGVYIAGNIYTWDGCTQEITDTDEDGLSNECESLLAYYFTPNLSVSEYDDVRREPRWAARPEDGQKVILLYMLSYWEDGGDTGSSSWWCGSFGVFQPEGCHGHSGDSEYLEETIQFNSDTHHWVLIGVIGSTHDSYRAWYARSGSSLTDEYGVALQFEGQDKSAPTMWVADGKHTSYGSQAECNDLGATVLILQTTSDACTNPRTVVPAGIGLQNENNIGSYSHQFIDCVETGDASHPAYSSHATECYWTWKRFHGWWNSTSNVGQLAYVDVLQTFGFVPN